MNEIGTAEVSGIVGNNKILYCDILFFLFLQSECLVFWLLENIILLFDWQHFCFVLSFCSCFPSELLMQQHAYRHLL